MNDELKKVTIYTDGACSGNPGIGGWGAVLIYGGKELEMSDYCKETTNNRMEMTAAIEALKKLRFSCAVDLYSDSSYLVDAFNKKWIEKWVANNWVKSDKKPVLNVDLWEELLSLCEKHTVNWIKVKGHADNEYNNRCDKLATTAIKQAKKLREIKGEWWNLYDV